MPPAPDDVFPGDRESGEVGWIGDCSVFNAAVVGPALLAVAIVRGFEGVLVVVAEVVVGETWVGCEDGEEEAPLPWMAEWARKAARKFAKKGRWVVGILVVCVWGRRFQRD